jgi:hypothetical protein
LAAAIAAVTQWCAPEIDQRLHNGRDLGHGGAILAELFPAISVEERHRRLRAWCDVKLNRPFLTSLERRQRARLAAAHGRAVKDEEGV